MVGNVMMNGRRAPYTSPKLSVYGGFAKLTAAGSGFFNEGPNQGPSSKATRQKL